MKFSTGLKSMRTAAFVTVFRRFSAHPLPVRAATRITLLKTGLSDRRDSGVAVPLQDTNQARIRERDPVCPVKRFVHPLDPGRRK